MVMKPGRAGLTLPRQLYSRAALIVLFPISGLLLVGSLVFIQRHYEDVTLQMSNNIVLDLGFLLDEVNGAESAADAQAVAARLADPLQFTVAFPGDSPPAKDLRQFYDLSGRIIIETLRGWNARIRAIDLKSNKHRVRVWMTTDQGPMFVSFGRSRVSAANPHQFLVLLFFSGIIMALITFFFLRNQLRPIRSLAKAATAFGKGQVVAYRPSGAIEIRQAGNAFLDMRRRIERHVEQRTNILSGVSHDLRTPLTRLKLGLTMLDDTDEVRGLLQDVNEMDMLLNEFLSFVRDGALDNPLEIDPVQVVRDAVEKAARTGARVSFDQAGAPCTVRARPQSLTRALNNLINNALRYGTQARVAVSNTEKSVTITVEDDGPGIPPDRRKDALEPFVRLDPSRNRNTGAGVGLGLAIANDIARQHGGTLTLAHSETLGGLKAILILPR